MTLEGLLGGKGCLGVAAEGLSGGGPLAAVECSDMRLSDCVRSASALFVDVR